MSKPKLHVGHYQNGLGGWFDVRYICLPDCPDYDGGLPGVAITWGRQKWFIVARDIEHFWSQWPYSMFKDCPCQPISTPAAGEA